MSGGGRGQGETGGHGCRPRKLGGLVFLPSKVNDSTMLRHAYIIITNICCLLIICQFSKHYMKDRQEDRESSQQPFTVDSTMIPISQMK